MTKPTVEPLKTTVLARREWAAKGLWIGIVLLAPLAAANHFSHWGWLFDLAANLSYFASFPLLIILFAAVVLRRPVAGVCSLIAAIMAAVPLLARIDFSQPAGHPGSNAAVLFCNLEGNTAAWDRLRQIIVDLEPELVALVEAGDDVVERIATDPALVGAYPYRITPEPGLQWSQVVLSRHPLELQKWQGDFQRYKFLYSFWRTARADLPQGSILFTVEHAPSPRNRQSWTVGNSMIRLLGELIKNQFATAGLPMMVAGDFNTSPTGYRDRLLREATGLQGDPLGGLPPGTWPSYFPPYCRLPLDRVWGSPEIVFTKREVLGNVGSDHRPILVHFRIMTTAL